MSNFLTPGYLREVSYPGGVVLIIVNDNWGGTTGGKPKTAEGFFIRTLID